ncbi:unnamed protein product [Rotaria magnacalcarata]|uniref:Methyltransferase n=1 Tax=Rotaria magnacalcarata TaxID=392030 RepID=A0A816RXT0_9BILA|nr:unnamed protein product [Rotaria magnacalcarata]CAF2083336.1 unnamed protein product [Rotaria magnacalcarata]CAF4196374.1 unnamed protein product [Rotaria magnacalcarata]CAF4212126.1 unnamed protein product [Rotaria magnacalcarata]
MGGDVIGDINYFSSTKDGCPPCVIPCSIPTTQRSNIEHACVPMTIYDLRGKEKSVDLDKNAFEILKYDGSIQEEFEEGSEAQQTYYKEISNILKQRLNTSKVIIYNYAFRSRGVVQPDAQHDDTHREPALYPHVDIDPSAVQDLVEKVLGKDESERAMKNRIQIINVWRPLRTNPITKNSLTLCDYRSVNAEKDVHSYTVRGAKLHAAGYLMSRDDQDIHRWYYLSQMQPDEMFVFKMTDTKPDVARFACHTAFINENEPTPSVEQTSLEVRCLILYGES